MSVVLRFSSVPSVVASLTRRRNVCSHASVVAWLTRIKNNIAWPGKCIMIIISSVSSSIYTFNIVQCYDHLIIYLFALTKLEHSNLSFIISTIVIRHHYYLELQNCLGVLSRCGKTWNLFLSCRLWEIFRETNTLVPFLLKLFPQNF